jgi:hypothetical protein
VSDQPEEETTQLPVDAPAPDAGERVDIVAPEPVDVSPEPPAYTPPEPPAPSGVAGERPELVVAGAFAGAFIFAKLLQRIGGNR